MLELAPADRPQRITLGGSYADLEPLDQARHGAALGAAGQESEDVSWEFLPYGPWDRPEDHRRWLAERQRDSDPLFFAVVVDGDAQGVASLMSIVPEHGRIEIGHVWFGPRLQRTAAATECFYLLARYAFELGNRRLEWKTNALNEPSRRAAHRLGFEFEGVFRQHQWVKGRSRDTAWFSMLDLEWPARAAAISAWLSPSNFDGEGRQRTPLER